MAHLVAWSGALENQIGMTRVDCEHRLGGRNYASNLALWPAIEPHVIETNEQNKAWGARLDDTETPAVE
jgi:hypothetical protein